MELLHSWQCTRVCFQGYISYSSIFFFFLYHAALPQWVRMINDTQMDSGEKLQWECKAIGRPRPTYRWLRNGLPLTSQVPSIHRPSSSLIAQFMQHYHVKYAHFHKHCFSCLRVELKSWTGNWPFTRCSRRTRECTSVSPKTNTARSTPTPSWRF